MGIYNMRAICPSCGGKIHTQPKHLFGRQTGKQCQFCGVALTGEIALNNRGVLVKTGPVFDLPPHKEPVPEEIAARRAGYEAEQEARKAAR